MKLSNSVTDVGTIPKKKNSSRIWSKQMIIPLVPESSKKSDVKIEEITFALRANPESKKSETYEITTTAFTHGTPEEFLIFRKTLKKILIGQNITTGREKFAMARRLLDGQSLSVFERYVSQNMDESRPDAHTDEALNEALDSVGFSIFPTNAIKTQRRALRRSIRKPVDMSVTHLIARLSELNEQLSQYPGGNEAAKLGEDELKEIIEFSLPMSWRKQMTLQRFHCYEKSIDEVINFCKDMEDYELAHPTERERVEKKISKKHPVKPNRRKRNFYEHQKMQEPKPFCKLHGYGHSTESCKVLDKQINKMKSEFEEKKSRYSKNANSKFSPKNRYNKDENHHIYAMIDQRIKELTERENVFKEDDEDAENYNTYMVINESDMEDVDHYDREYEYVERGRKGRPFKSPEAQYPETKDEDENYYGPACAKRARYEN